MITPRNALVLLETFTWRFLHSRRACRFRGPHSTLCAIPPCPKLTTGVKHFWGFAPVLRMSISSCSPVPNSYHEQALPRQYFHDQSPDRLHVLPDNNLGMYFILVIICIRLIRKAQQELSQCSMRSTPLISVVTVMWDACSCTLPVTLTMFKEKLVAEFQVESHDLPAH